MFETWWKIYHAARRSSERLERSPPPKVPRAGREPADLVDAWHERHEVWLRHGALWRLHVHIDGAPARSCITPVDSIGASMIMTIEAIGATAAGATYPEHQ
jgi:hypothetical protein